MACVSCEYSVFQSVQIKTREPTCRWNLPETQEVKGGFQKVKNSNWLSFSIVSMTAVFPLLSLLMKSFLLHIFPGKLVYM